MRTRLILLSGLFAASLGPAVLAQTPSSPSFTLPAADVASTYCVYGGLLYSIGSIVTVGEGGPTMAIRCSENRQWQALPSAAPAPTPGRR